MNGHVDRGAGLRREGVTVAVACAKVRTRLYRRHRICCQDAFPGIHGPREHLSLLSRAALRCEGTACKKVARIPAAKLKTSDENSVKLLVSMLGGAWGRTELQELYELCERATYGTVQKADESNDSYLARHDINFEELVARGTILDEVRAYILLRQSQLTSDDRKRIVVEANGFFEYSRICASIRLLGSSSWSHSFTLLQTCPLV